VAYRFGFSVELRTRFTKDWDILNVRAMAAGSIPALNDARIRFALPSGISSISLAGAAPVGSFKPNPWGLYDMLGNVANWVEDCVNSYSGYSGTPTDGSPNTSGDCASRVVRGGSWSSAPRQVRAAKRFASEPDAHYLHLESMPLSLLRNVAAERRNRRVKGREPLIAFFEGESTMEWPFATSLRRPGRRRPMTGVGGMKSRPR
jgi:hypothetical protein